MSLTFGGHPARIYELAQKTYITCKGVTGSLDQLEEWNRSYSSDPQRKYYFGYDDKLSEIKVDPITDRVHIACLSEDYNEFKQKLNKLLHDVNTRVV